MEYCLFMGGDSMGVVKVKKVRVEVEFNDTGQLEYIEGSHICDFPNDFLLKIVKKVKK